MRLRGPVLARGLVLLLASLIQLTPWALVGTGLAALEPALLVLMWQNAAGGARKAFAVALVALAMGALADALTPSYDASFLWAWAGGAMTLIAGLAVLGGFAFLAPRAALIVLGLGTLLSLSRLVVEDVLAARLAAAGCLALGHILLSRSLPKPVAAAGPFPAEAAGGLFRWGLVELSRLIIFAAAFVAGLAVRFRDSDFQIIALAAVGACAVAAAIGYRPLARFCDGAAALGVRSSLAKALPLMGIVVTLGVIPGVAESAITGREAALVRADVSAAVVCILAALGLWALSGTTRRTARALSRRGMALALALVSWSLLGLPLLLLLSSILESAVDWEARRLLHQIEALMLAALVATWIASVIVLLVAGKKLRAHGAPGGVGAEVAHGA